MIERLALMLLKMLIDYLLNPENVKSLLRAAADYVEEKAAEKEVNFWDTLGNFMNLVREVIKERKEEKSEDCDDCDCDCDCDDETPS